MRRVPGPWPEALDQMIALVCSDSLALNLFSHDDDDDDDDDGELAWLP